MGGSTATANKNSTATAWIRRMIDFIKGHPDGYSEDDVLWLIKAWLTVGKNWYNPGTVVDNGGDQYPAMFVRDWLTDDNLSKATPPESGKASTRLREELENMLTVAHRLHGYDYTISFQDTTSWVEGFVADFKVGLTAASPERAKKFAHSLSVLKAHYK